MDPQTLLDHYVKAIADLHSDSEDANPICQLIDVYHAKFPPPYQTLLEGEKAFWNKDFETALKKYLQAKNLPNIQFFCFRASAFISEKMGHHDQAVDYARKALAFYPKDPSTTTLYNRLSSTDEIQQILKDYQPSLVLFEEKEPTEKPPHPEPPAKIPSTLLQKIKEFQNNRDEELKQYQKHLEERSITSDECLAFLNGWSGAQSPYTHDASHAHTGIFLRSQGYGVVINPGRHFLDHFHHVGYSLHDIDTIIVTQSSFHCYEDLLPIHQLNTQLNEIAPKRHPINYYLHPTVHSELAKTLKSQYKEERYALHSLEIYVDSTNSESIPLTENIHLKYFSSHSSDNTRPHTLGVTLEIPEHKIGYLSGCSWSPMTPLHLKGCDILCLGIGYATKEDVELQKYLPDCLGFYGTHSLLEHLNPKILLCTEFSGNRGDIRLEFVHEVRRQNRIQNVFPADFGFYLELKKTRIRCSVSSKFINPEHVKVTRAQGCFSKLHYLPEESVL